MKPSIIFSQARRTLLVPLAPCFLRVGQCSDGQEQTPAHCLAPLTVCEMQELPLVALISLSLVYWAPQLVPAVKFKMEKNRFLPIAPGHSQLKPELFCWVPHMKGSALATDKKFTTQMRQRMGKWWDYVIHFGVAELRAREIKWLDQSRAGISLPSHKPQGTFLNSAWF